ncbi:MAG TPA: hypothetical protein VKC34_18690 [Blastocatellia bacterium]|nr:hypothetical protein [Blastocatellia bacterium]
MKALCFGRSSGDRSSRGLEVTPEKPGEYEFTCGMNVCRGRLIVK